MPQYWTAPGDGNMGPTSYTPGTPQSDLSSEDISQSSTAENYLDMLKQKSTQDDFWMEKYIDALERENDVKSAREYDEYVRSHYYQNMSEDLKKAGFNPYLALNSLGGSNGTTIMKNASNYSASSAKASAKNAETREDQVITQTITSLAATAAHLLPFLLLTLI